jgi:hypothetical protein
MRYPISRPPTLTVIYGNRDFFPDHLVAEARTDLTKLFVFRFTIIPEVGI